MNLHFLRRFQRILLWGAAGFALLAGTAYLTLDRVMDRLIHSKPIVELPNFRGKSFIKAYDMAKQQGLELVKLTEVADQRYPAGSIIQQIPQPGMKVRVGKKVRVILSQGGRLLFVPDAVGQELRSAEILIRNSGFSLGEVTRVYSSRVPKDQVAAQFPSGGVPTSRSALVSLVVSDGEAPSGMTLVPDFVGKRLAEAIEWVGETQAALAVSPSGLASNGAAVVIRQSPYGGTEAKPGLRLRLTVTMEPART